MAGWQDGAEGWINLAYDDEEMVDHSMPTMPTAPQYPYGTRFCLTGRELEMAQLPLPKVGQMLDCRIMAEVTGVSDQGGEQRVELQMILMKCLENEDEEPGMADDDE